MFSQPRGSGTRNMVEKNQWMAIVATTAISTAGTSRTPNQTNNASRNSKRDWDEADRFGNENIDKQQSERR